MAWEDRTPFDAIEATYGLNQNQVEDLMRDNLKKTSYVVWRKRAQGRKTKHVGLQEELSADSLSPNLRLLLSKTALS